MTWFVLAYHRLTRTILERHDFPEKDNELALAERARLTSQHIGDRQIEVVLLGSQSEASLRVTHARYFSRAAS